VGVTFSGFAQGEWDMKYAPIDSVNNTWIGKEIRIDFKTSQDDVIIGNVSLFEIRKLLSKKDTVTLKVDEREIDFIEDWKFYVDHGVLSDQTLKATSEEQSINELFIESVNDSTIIVKMNFYKPEKCKSSGMVLSDSKTITVDKKIIKGVLFRRNEQ